jgi:L-methionine (R)-S-oxide reductase
MAEPYRFRRRMDPEQRHRPAAEGNAAQDPATMLVGDLADDVALRNVVEALAASHPNWGWVGVYLLVGDTLVLGPYVGPATEHTRIPVGTGVCGTAVAEGRNVVVEDVTALDNYLACSVGTRSEIVVLIRDGDDVVGQFDVDSDDVGAFGPDDEALLEQLAHLAGPRCRRLAAGAA